MDRCKSVREFYSVILTKAVAIHWIAIFLCGLPLYYLIGLIILMPKTIAITFLSGAMYILLSVMSFAWIFSGICIWRVWPNGLTISIFIFKAVGYWSLVSFIILIFYGTSVLQVNMIMYLVATFMPEVILLLITSDILRTIRTKQYQQEVDIPVAVVRNAH